MNAQSRTKVKRAAAAAAADSVENWRTKLSALLDQGKTAAASGDSAAVRRVSKALTQFVIDSPGALGEGILALDEIAQGAVSDFLIEDINRQVDAIAARTAELARLTKQMEAQAAQTAEEANSIRLQRAHAVVETLTKSVGALVDLRVALKEGDDAQLAKRIEEALGIITSVRDAVDADRISVVATPT